jgi:hypothetical protein
LVQEVVGILEEQQARLEEETEEEVHELLSASGLSEEQFSDYLTELFRVCVNGIFDINQLVSKPHFFGYQIDHDAAWRKWNDLSSILRKKMKKRSDSAIARLRRALESRSQEHSYLAFLIHLASLILSCYETYALALDKYSMGIYQSAATLGWRFETLYEDGDAARAFREMWRWDVIEQEVVEPFLDLYRASVKNMKEALLANHKIRLLYSDGQALLESGLLDELG